MAIRETQPHPLQRGGASVNRNSTIDKLKACDLPGVYFRHWQMHDQVRPLWTLMVSLWYPLVLFSILPVLWIFRRWHLWRLKSSQA
ncbi:MAG TPA: hypothetical protein VJT54_15510 [Verrucomicrobiae bacterium]|nr:hypothetical protein [Verrucomicrobiae bacterium]